MINDVKDKDRPKVINHNTLDRPIFSFENEHGLYELDRGNRFSIRDGK